MFTHRQVWQALEMIAERNHLSVSGLAKKAGLDPTSFNRSKRIGADGRKRWPSTESLSKVLQATNTSSENFISLMKGSEPGAMPQVSIPLIGLAQAGGGGFFDDAGFPVGAAWDEISFPGFGDENAYALEITGDSMEPVYRDGDLIIVSPNSSCRRGDRVVVKTTQGEVMAKVLARQTIKSLELTSFNPDYSPKNLSMEEVEWIARIVWAAQ